MLTQTISTTTQFMGRIGQEYYFQIRATDNVSNTGAWVQAGPVEITSVTKYYTHGGTRVAMRQGDEVYYLHGDHLGSTSLTTDSSGAVVSEVRYLPYGEERWTNEVASPADFGFTSQREEKGFGLYDYKARYYSPYLGRFISPDSIVPEPDSSSGFNRYRYARNNPLKYVDPSGHEPCDSGNWGDCQKPKPKPQKPPVTPPDEGQEQLENYDPDLPAKTGAATSAVGVPAAYTTAIYNLGKPPGAFSTHPIEYMPTTVNKFGQAATLGMPIYNGYVNGSDINARQNLGMLSEYGAMAEHTNNAAFTTLNLGTNYFLLEAATPTFVVGGSYAVPTILSSPATIVLAVPSIGMVTAWEQQTINNLIEGMPQEQAWKAARDTTFEPALNLFGATRETHPQWYWYPEGY